MGGFEEIEHTADWGLRIWGEDVGDLIISGARGLNHLLGVHPCEAGAPRIRRTLRITAIDAESLLVEWLAELVYLAESESLIFEDFSIDRLTPTDLTVRASGCRCQHIDKLIKAVTYHGVEIENRPGGVEVTVVFDV